MDEQSKIAIVVSIFNEEITEALCESTLLRLKELDVQEDQIKLVKVPGAIEIPITAKWLTLTGKYQAIICLGAVIRGDTSHFDYVCSQVSYGCQKLALESKVPIIFGVLTTDNIKQALERSRGPMNKGIEAADTAIAMIKVLEDITNEKA